MPVTLTETVSAAQRASWPVPEMPAIGPEQEPWAGVPAFWRESVAERPVDQDRTYRLADHDVPIGASAGGEVWKGVSYGMPFHLVDANGPMTAVWDASRSVQLRWGKPPILPIVPTPLPLVVRREGDPGGEFDRHAYCYAPGVALWEAMQIDRHPVNWIKSLGRTDWVAGYDNGRGIKGGGIVRWDCTRPWAAPGQPRGLVAAGIPQFPLILRWDEIERGRIGHALFLAVPQYAPEVTGPARGTDGHVQGHPLRAGERLRLPEALIDQHRPGTAERIVAECLAEFGCVVGDTAPAAGFTLTQDRRWARGSDRIGPLGDMGLRLSDFLVVRS